jgi:hypothetical protein
MKKRRTMTWARVRVCFGGLLIALFALGVLLLYAATFNDPGIGRRRSDLLTAGAALIALSVVSALAASVLKRRLTEEE